jgi:hypothetical protein
VLVLVFARFVPVQFIPDPRSWTLVFGHFVLGLSSLAFLFLALCSGTNSGSPGSAGSAGSVVRPGHLARNCSWRSVSLVLKRRPDFSSKKHSESQLQRKWKPDLEEAKIIAISQNMASGCGDHLV